MGNIYPAECRVSENSKIALKAFLVNNTKKQRKTIEQERLELSLRKLEIPREHFVQR